MAPLLPADGSIKLLAAFAGEANHAIGERRRFKIEEKPPGEILHFTGRLAYDQDFNITVIDIQPA